MSPAQNFPGHLLTPFRFQNDAQRPLTRSLEWGGVERACAPNKAPDAAGGGDQLTLLCRVPKAHHLATYRHPGILHLCMRACLVLRTVSGSRALARPPAARRTRHHTLPAASMLLEVRQRQG